MIEIEISDFLFYFLVQSNTCRREARKIHHRDAYLCLIDRNFKKS